MYILKEYFEIILNNMLLSISLFTLIFLIYLFLYKRFLFGIFDPLFFTMLGQASSTFSIAIMYMYNLINKYYLWNYFFNEILLYLGFFLGYKINNKLKYYTSINQRYNNKIEFITIYYIFTFIYILFQLLSFKLFGLGIFLETSRLDMYQGYGYINRILNATAIPSMILIMIKLFYYKEKNIYDKLLIALLFFAALTSGSKSAILPFLITSFISIYIINIYTNNMYSKNIKNFKKFIPVLIIFILIAVFFINADKSFFGILSRIFSRFLISGDIYMLGYHENIFNNFHSMSALNYIFAGIIPVINKFGFNIDTALPIGTQIFHYYVDTQQTLGPNARYNYLFFFLFGYIGSLLFSFLLGFIISYSRFKKISIIHPVSIFIQIFVILKLPGAISDLPYTIYQIFNFLLLFLPIYFLTLAMKYIILKRFN